MPSFTVDAVRQTIAPDWLRARRVQAAEAFADAVRPTHEAEIWRYSRIDDFELDRFTPIDDAPTITGADGLLVEEPTGAPGDTDDYFELLNRAWGTPLVIRVPAGRVLESPIVIEHVLPGAGSATFPQLVIEAGADSEVTVVQRFRSPDGEVALVVPQVEVIAGQSARVAYLGINELGDGAWMIARQRVTGQRDSVATVANVSLGGHYARVRTDAAVTGIGAETRQIALYFADGDQMHDFRTIQYHGAPKTSADLLFKGAVHDTARSVYTGLIHISPEGKGTTAYQTNRNLTLSEGAWAESVPNLEIETNDVKCSHASTVGPVDAEQRFFLESRGIRPETAERLIVMGFFDEVINRLPAPAERAALHAAVAAKLDRHHEGKQW